MEGNIINANIASLTIDDDRISELPDCIAHHILSFLVNCPKVLIRTSLLSKRWFDITASLPILAFDIGAFPICKGVPYDPEYRKEAFNKYVEYTTSRFSQQQNVVSANSFKLGAKLKDPTHAEIIDRCLGLILKQGLQEFVIFNYGINLKEGQQPPTMYRLPDKLLSVSSLTYLKMHYCELPSSFNYIVNFKLLKLLYLEGVYLNEELIKCLTAGCPLLEEFNVCKCYGFKKFRVNGLHSLQKFKIYCNYEVEEVNIQAPNLSVIDFSDSYEISEPCVSLYTTKKLQMIFYRCLSKQFRFPLSNFPFLETLVLELSFRHCYENVKLSSRSLKNLSLETCSDLDELKIDTPNLLHFLYFSKWSFGNPSIRTLGESKACVECYPRLIMGFRWFQKFRLFLDRTIRFKVLKLHICLDFIFVEIKKLKLPESSPFELEHIELYVDDAQELSKYLYLVDAVLWCWCPRSLTLCDDPTF